MLEKQEMKSKEGFTLVEMSVTVAIISLILSGVLGGRHLLRVTQMNKIMEDFNYYATATRNFREKYGALPGDMADATRFFGRDSSVSSAATCLQGASDNNRTGGTCNGGGDGRISYGSSATISNLEYANWAQHLTASKIIEMNNYTGYAGWQSAGSISIPGTTHPLGREENSIVWAGYLNSDSSTIFQTIAESNVLVLENGRAGFGAFSATLTPEDTRNLDKKFDDGFPASGKLATYTGAANPNCTLKANGSATSAYNDINAIYNLNYKGKACLLLFVGGY